MFVEEEGKHEEQEEQEKKEEKGEEEEEEKEGKKEEEEDRRQCDPCLRFYRSAQPRFPLEALSEAASVLNADNSDKENDVAETTSADIGDCDLGVSEDEEEDEENEEEDQKM
ncbi:hypothetical protein FQA39_LY06070 [Lamprigera yunnana]|nr:hypothetical protein FQA39_LY06070 [Lamprigera yunnana]